MNAFGCRLNLIRRLWCGACLGVLLICLAGANLGYAQRRQPALVTVHVIDFDSEAPLYQAEVRLKTFASGTFVHRAFTDGAGQISFPAVEPGSYYLEAEKLGYVTAQENVDVSPGASENYSIRLRSKPDSHSPDAPASTVSAATLAAPASARKEFQRGMDKLKDDPVKSIGHFRKAIQEFPEYAEAYAMLGLAYTRTKETRDALAASTKAVALNPKLPVARTLLGRLYLEERKFGQAESELLESIRLDPMAWDAPYELSRCYFNTGKLDQALDYARRAHELPQASSATHLLLADIYLRQRNQQSALHELEEFVQADPHSPFMPQVQQKIDQLRNQK